MLSHRWIKPKQFATEHFCTNATLNEHEKKKTKHPHQRRWRCKKKTKKMKRGNCIQGNRTKCSTKYRINIEIVCEACEKHQLECIWHTQQKNQWEKGNGENVEWYKKMFLSFVYMYSIYFNDVHNIRWIDWLSFTRRDPDENIFLWKQQNHSFIRSWANVNRLYACVCVCAQYTHRSRISTHIPTISEHTLYVHYIDFFYSIPFRHDFHPFDSRWFHTRKEKWIFQFSLALKYLHTLLLLAMHMYVWTYCVWNGESNSIRTCFNKCTEREKKSASDNTK